MVVGVKKDKNNLMILNYGKRYTNVDRSKGKNYQ